MAIDLSQISPAALASLESRLAGDVLTERDPHYDAARLVWNGMIDRSPAVIARCMRPADVSVAIGFGREYGLPIAVRGGGHNVAGTAVVDDGLVIDLSRMREVRVDASGATVHVQGGATWGDVDRVTQPLGLATPGGVVSETGVAGLALSGGLSSQRRLHGMTIDNLVSAEVVLADGRVVQASEVVNPDLFWALRGGGGNFGVVTSFELRLHELGPQVFALNVAYPVEDAVRVLARWRETVVDASDRLTTEALVWTLPDAPELPAELRGRPFVGVAGMYAGPVEEGEELCRPLRSLASPLVDMSGVRAYLDLQQALDPMFPAGLRYYWKALYLEALPDSAFDLIASWSDRRPSQRTVVVLRHCGGAIARVDAAATAFGDRGAPWMLSIDSTWERAADDDANIAWTRAFWNDVRRYSRGKAYFNFPGLLEEGDAAVRESYGDNFARLARVKAAFDPDNVFRLNQNVRPVR